MFLNDDLDARLSVFVASWTNVTGSMCDDNWSIWVCRIIKVIFRDSDNTMMEKEGIKQLLVMFCWGIMQDDSERSRFLNIIFLLLSDRVESPIYFLCVTVCVKEHRMCVFRCVVWKEIISETVLRRLLFCCCSELHPGSCGPELLRCSAQWTRSPLEPWGTIPAAGRRRNTAVHKLLSDLSFLHFNFTFTLTQCKVLPHTWCPYKELPSSWSEGLMPAGSRKPLLCLTDSAAWHGG